MSQANIEMFQGVTGATAEVATQMLRRHNGNVEQALSAYFEAGMVADEPPPPVAPPPRSQRAEPAWSLESTVNNPNVSDCVEVVDLRSNQPLPLVGMRVHAVVLDLTADVDAVFRFVNDGPDTVEAQFVFRNDDVAVCGFEAQIGDTQIEGVIDGKAEARKKYQDAVRSGDGGFLLEEGTNSGSFQLSIGNLRSGESCLVRVRYVMPLEQNAGEVLLPLSLLKTPLRDGDVAAADDAAAAEVPAGAQVSVSVTMPCDITGVVSDTHEIDVVQAAGEADVAEVNVGGSFSGTPSPLMLRFALDDPTAPRLECQQSGLLDSQGVMLTLVPELGELEDVTTEVVFLVDRSGSMAGSRIKQARNALQLFLRALPMGTRFNIVGFGSRFEKLFPRPVVYNERTMRRARNHVASMKADLEQTDILPPLRAILEEPERPGFPRQLFVLTDGDVANTSQVLDYVRDAASTTRIFTFGIGADASRRLVSQLARLGRGIAEFVASGQRLEPVVGRQVSRALQPAILNATIHWGDALQPQMLQCPQSLPPVFNGEAVVVYGLLEGGVDLAEGAVDGCHTVTLSGTVNNEIFEIAIPLDVAEDVTGGDLIQRVAAARLIQELERGVRRGGSGGPAAKRKMRRLGMQYGILSGETSFVAVDKRDAEARRAVIRSRLVEVEIDPAERDHQAATERDIVDTPAPAPQPVPPQPILPVVPIQPPQPPAPPLRPQPTPLDDPFAPVMVAAAGGGGFGGGFGGAGPGYNAFADAAAMPQPQGEAAVGGFGFGALDDMAVLQTAPASAAPPAPPAVLARNMAAPAPPPPGAAGGAPPPRGGRRRGPPPMGGRGRGRARGSTRGAPAPSSSSKGRMRKKKSMAKDQGRRRTARKLESREEEEKVDRWAVDDECDAELSSSSSASVRSMQTDEDEDSDDDAFAVDFTGLRPIDTIVMLQTAVGSWSPSAHLTGVLGVDPMSLVPGDIGCPEDAVAAVWTTAVVLAFLENVMGDHRTEWRMLAVKAKKWLRAQCAAVAGGDVGQHVDGLLASAQAAISQ